MGIFDWIAGAVRPAPPPDAATRALIEQAATAVDPLIKQLGGYERKLAPAVQHAYDYCERLALAIPGPFPISRAAFADDPLVHALFGSADDIEAMLATSLCVRDYLGSHPAAPSGQCFALLGMRRKITAGFGARLAGEMVQRDEPQKTLSFTDHTLAEPGVTLDEVHRRLARTMFDGLLKGLVASVGKLRAERQALLDARAMEYAQERSAGAGERKRHLEEIQERLRETAAALQPEQMADTLAAYLAEPRAALRLEQLRLRVDRFGIIVEDARQGEHADALRFAELTGRDPRHWAVMIVKIDRAEARAAIERFEAGRRYIVI